MSQTKFVEKIKTHIVLYNFFSSENRAVYEMVQPYRPETDNTMRRRKDAICVPDNTDKNTDTQP
jgi:hypothetical protein